MHRRIVLIHVQFIFSHEIRFVFALKQSLLARTQYMRERCIYARCCDFYVSAFTKQLSPNSAFLSKILIRLDIITIIFQQYFDKNSHTFYSVAKCSVLPLCYISLLRRIRLQESRLNDLTSDQMSSIYKGRLQSYFLFCSKG